LLSTVAIGVFILGLVVGWKLRSFWERRPRFLRWGKKKTEAPGASPPEAKDKGGVIDRLSRTGEKLVGKGVETIFGKPKTPKDDKEKP